MPYRAFFTCIWSIIHLVFRKFLRGFLHVLSKLIENILLRVYLIQIKMITHLYTKHPIKNEQINNITNNDI